MTFYLIYYFEFIEPQFIIIYVSLLQLCGSIKMPAKQSINLMSCVWNIKFPLMM